jgi:hypothetical protein
LARALGIAMTANRGSVVLMLEQDFANYQQNAVKISVSEKVISWVYESVYVELRSGNKFEVACQK